MIQNKTSARLIRLEAHLLKPGCRTCAAWPPVRCLAHPDDEPTVPDRCPDCGRRVVQATIIGVSWDAI